MLCGLYSRGGVGVDFVDGRAGCFLSDRIGRRSQRTNDRNISLSHEVEKAKRHSLPAHIVALGEIVDLRSIIKIDCKLLYILH